MRGLVIWALLSFALAAGANDADLRLPAVFSDGLILQRDRPVPVWGWAMPGAAVTVAFAGQEQKATADAQGRWTVTLPPMPAHATGRPLTVIVGGSARAVRTVADVLVGEVWFTAGQSNMMMGLGSATGGTAFYEQHQAETRGRIRVVNGLGPHLLADTPQTDIAASWAEPTASYSAVSYWLAYKLFEHFKREVPIGMVTYTAIAGAEAWVDRATLQADPRLRTVLDDALDFDAKCYNGVIAAIAPFAVRGIVYYQAEYNGFGERAVQFRALFPALIACWRRAWQQPNLPFLFVQLPGFIAAEAPANAIDMDPATLARYRTVSGRGTWTEVREAQLLTWRSTPHTGMAVAIDLGEPYDIHPPNKEPVAQRLFLQARHVAYGEKLVHSGPIPTRTEARGAALVVSFDQIGAGLTARGGELKGFLLAGADAVFHPATAAIDGACVVVRSAQVPSPRHLRYAWDGCPDATLYNTDGLPATPFRWSDWTRAPQPDSDSFDWPNGSFEELDRAGRPAAWRLGPGTAVTATRASDGRQSVVLTNANASALFITGITAGTGAYWNAPPLTGVSVRPGCLISYGVDLAVEPGDGEQALYCNLCQDDCASGYQAWGGLRTATTAQAHFVTRTIVQRATDTIAPSHFCYPDAAGARLIFQGGRKPGRLYVDHLTPVRILRPTLTLSAPGSIAIGPVAPGVTAVSAELRVGNGQRATFRQLLRDDDTGTEFETILYGTAAFAADGMGPQQKLIAPTDHVGAILAGPDAEHFEFVGAHADAARRQLRLIGDDGQGGLAGGAQAEHEVFAIRFTGADKPGIYRAALRIVTQAGNVGTLSQGEPGEPPVNLYYIDRPIAAEVRTK